jgi:hypothetical protein
MMSTSFDPFIGRSLVDRIWIEVHDKDGNSIEVMSFEHEAFEQEIEIRGVNIVVPHRYSKGQNQPGVSLDWIFI